jgi:hypothetical protein
MDAPMVSLPAAAQPCRDAGAATLYIASCRGNVHGFFNSSEAAQTKVIVQHARADISF